MTKNIESKVSKTILQQSEEIIVGDDVIKIAQPSLATIILASEEIAKMPSIKLDSDNVLMETLCFAKDCQALGDILAILILGAKNLSTKKISEKRTFFGLIKKRSEEIIDKKTELAKKLLENLSPSEFYELTARILKTLQVADFFGLTTSLIEVNLIRQTRGVVSETTASGR